MINLKIDGKEIKAHPSATVLEAALQAGIYIPNLCYHPDIPPAGACRLCIVSIKGGRGVVTSCTVKVREGMEVTTNNDEIRKMRENILWLTLSELPEDIDETSQLYKVARWTGIKNILENYSRKPKNIPVKTEDPLFIRDMNRCILCGRCVRMCRDIRKTGVLGFSGRGIDTTVETAYGMPLADSACKFCEACVEVCPSGALEDKRKPDPSCREKTLVPCTNNCPAKIDAARYVKLIALGKYREALEVVRETVPFPEVLGHVCDHPCEEECRRNDINEAIAIRSLKRFAAEKGSDRWRDKIKILPDTGKKIAVVGAGPAGLTAAWFLNRLGHSVTVFEAGSSPGGMMRTGIPAYRLPRDVLDREIKDIVSFGVKIKTGIKIENLEELFKEGFSAVFLATGASETMTMGIEGEDDTRVLQGIGVLGDISSKKDTGLKGKVAVVGGGNVAIDVARSALRSGAEKAVILYRRTREEMPALEEEVEDALKEGVEIRFLTAPVKIASSGENLKIECIKMKLGKPDSGGRRRPVPIEGSEYVFEADRLAMAIGQKPSVPGGCASLKNDWGGIEVDGGTMKSSMEGVFAGGDAVSGPASVIKAIRDGRKAASSIDRYLGGSGDIDQKLARDETEMPCLGREEGFAFRARAEMPLLDGKKRTASFCAVEKGLPEKEALEEAGRCLSCALRLGISEAPEPPVKEEDSG